MDKDILFLYIRTQFETVEFGKDTCLFPKYINKMYGYNATVLYADPHNSKNIKPGCWNNVRYESIPVSKKYLKYQFTPSIKKNPLLYGMLILKFVIFLKKNKQYKRVFLFHLTPATFLISFFYKKINPTGKILVKADMQLEKAKEMIYKKSIFEKLFCKYIDMVTVETTNVYKVMINDKYYYKKIYLLPNGFDNLDNDKEKYNKENLILSVSRYGSYQKNSEILLSIFSKIKLNNWRVILIGPIMPNFEVTIKVFFNKYPELRNNIEFVGNISDKKKVYEYYKRAKIFILPSRYESFGIATLEALYFEDYPLLTDVGAAWDLTNQGKFGYVCPNSSTEVQDDEKITSQMKETLQKIINGEKDIKEIQYKGAEFIRQFFLMSEIIKSKPMLLFLGEKNE